MWRRDTERGRHCLRAAPWPRCLCRYEPPCGTRCPRQPSDLFSSERPISRQRHRRHRPKQLSLMLMVGSWVSSPLQFNALCHNKDDWRCSPPLSRLGTGTARVWVAGHIWVFICHMSPIRRHSKTFHVMLTELDCQCRR